MTDVTEIKIKWDTFYFFLVGAHPDTMREKKEGKEKLEHRQTTENHDTRANSMRRCHSSELVTLGVFMVRFGPVLT